MELAGNNSTKSLRDCAPGILPVTGPVKSAE